MNTLSRREWLCAAATTISLAGLARADAHASPLPKRPNIVFIMADDLGYGDLGCYGQQVIQTPHIDAMAAEGARFTQCYAGSTVCAPSRCALMTGLHTGHCYIRGNKRVPLRPDDRTVAEVMKDQGYTTGLIGKWGLGNEETTGIPNRQGFDYFFGYLDQAHAHNYFPEYLWRNEEKVPLEGNEESEPQVAIKRAQFSHDLMAEEALKWIDENKADPFFLYLAFTLPHANNEGGRATGNGMEIPDTGIYAKEDWPDPQKGHAAMITRLDRDVGRILQKLKDAGVAENTLVIFTSDNGPHKEGGADPEFFHSSGPLRGYKRDLYEGGIRVPAIAWWPGTIQPNQTCDQVWAFWDIFPTAAELAGAPAPDGLDGISLVPTIQALSANGAPDQPQHDYLYWEFHEGAFKQAVRKGNWKGIRLDVGQPLELYDISNDLGEKHNIAEAHPEVVADLAAIMDAARSESEHWPVAKKA